MIWFYFLMYWFVKLFVLASMLLPGILSSFSVSLLDLSGLWLLILLFDVWSLYFLTFRGRNTVNWAGSLFLLGSVISLHSYECSKGSVLWKILELGLLFFIFLDLIDLVWVVDNEIIILTGFYQLFLISWAFLFDFLSRQ